jgi:hypothetical protein
MPDITLDGVTFHYGEMSFSGLGRGISMYRKGVAKDNHVYKFKMPNPHDDPFYNKNQGKWYDEAANAIATQVNNGGWPTDGGTVTVHGTVYTLEVAATATAAAE